MPEIISVHSFRRDTGKTSIVANTASQVALRGKRVAIINTHFLQAPDLALVFGLGENRINRTLNDYLWDKCEIVDAAYDVTRALPAKKGPTGAVEGKLFLVPSSIEPGEIVRALREGHDVARLNDGYHELIEDLELDYLFVDTPPGLNEETLLSIAVSDQVLIVLRPDKQDFQVTAVTVDVSRELEVPHIYLVVNKCLDRYDFAKIRSDVSEKYETTVAAMLPFSEDVVELGLAGGVFSLKLPDHPFSAGIREIVEQVLSTA